MIEIYTNMQIQVMMYENPLKKTHYSVQVNLDLKMGNRHGQGQYSGLLLGLCIQKDVNIALD